MTLFVRSAPAAMILLAGCAAVPAQRPASTAPLPVSDPAPLPAPEQAKPAAAVASTPMPPELMYQLMLAEIAAQRGQYNVALESYLQLARSHDDAKFAERATQLALWARDDAKAREAAELWLKRDPDDFDAHRVAAEFAIRGGELDKAKEQLDYLLTHPGETQDNGYAAVTELLAHQPDKAAALTLMKRLLETRQNDAEAWAAYTRLAIRTGNLEEASAGTQRVLALRPNWQEAVILRAEILRMQGKQADGLEYMEKYLRKNAKDSLVRTYYARMLVDARQNEKALKQLEMVARQEPDNPDVLLHMALLSLDLNRINEGEAYLLKLNRSGNRYFESAFYLGVVAEDFRKDASAALAWYSKVDRGEHYFDAQLRAAVLLAKQGELELARAHLRSMRAQGPAQALRIYYVEGAMLRDAGREQEAVDTYTEGLKEIPDNPELLYARAMAYEKLNKVDLMEADLRRILERDPNNVEALNALGYTLADKTDRYQEALELIKKALDSKPDSHYVLDSMGWVQYRLGNNELALDYLQRAYQIERDPEIAAHLVEVLWASGKRQEAQELWQRAIQAAPDHAGLQGIMQRLDPDDEPQ